MELVQTDEKFTDEKCIIKRYVESKLSLDPRDDEQKEELEKIMHKPKKEIAKILQQASCSDKPIFIGEQAEDCLNKKIEDNGFLTGGTETIDTYVGKIKDRKLTEKEYTKIMQEIAEHHSILPLTNRREYGRSPDYHGGCIGDVVLSIPNNQAYYLNESGDLSQFIDDYSGYNYYTSRFSGNTGEGYVYAGKKSLIYIPQETLQNYEPSRRINGLNICAWHDVYNEQEKYPITLIHEKDSPYQFTFVDAANVSTIHDLIVSGGASGESLPAYEENYTYIDQSGNTQNILISYLSDRPLSQHMLRNIINASGIYKAETEELEATGSEFDRVVGIYKSGNNYVQKGPLNFANRLFGKENPRDRLVHDNVGTALFEYTIGDGNNLQKEYYGGYEQNIRGWKMYNSNTVYRKDREHGGYKVMMEYPYTDLCISEFAENLMLKVDDSRRDRVGKWGRGYEINDGKESVSCNVFGTKEGVIFTINGIEKDDIQATVTLLQKGSGIVKEIYGNQLPNVFYKTLKNIKENGDIDEGRERYGDMLYTIFDDQVFLGYITKNTDLNERFSVLSGEYQDYEKVISLEEWNTGGKEHRRKEMKKAAYNKSITQYISYKKHERAKINREEDITLCTQRLKRNSEHKFFIEDSIAMGNCVPGTKGFMDQYSLYDGISAKEILENPRFDQIIQRDVFRQIISSKI